MLDFISFPEYLWNISRRPPKLSQNISKMLPCAKYFWQTNIVFNKKVAICQLPSLILSLGFDAWFHFISKISPEHFQKTSKIILEYFQNTWQTNKVFHEKVAILSTLISFGSECDIRENFDTNKYPKFKYICIKKFTRMNVQIYSCKTFDSNEYSNKYSY